MNAKLPAFDAPAEEWIQAGLAIPSEKGKGVNFREVSFTAAQANNLVFLTGRGALTLDRVGKQKTPPAPN